MYAALGTSSGHVEFHRIDFAKRRLELQGDSTLALSGSVLCMKRVKVSATQVTVIVGMSSGDIVVSTVDGANFRVTNSIVVSKIHDFGVNSLDAQLITNQEGT